MKRSEATYPLTLLGEPDHPITEDPTGMKRSEATYPLESVTGTR